jgi:hypothetical protein
MTNGLLEAIAASDAKGASEELERELKGGRKAWEIHLSLFPVVQRVMNPPFINPHLPKMHGIYRDLVSYLEEGELPALVRLEVNEYARRAKLAEMPRAALPTQVTPVAVKEMEAAIADQDPERTAVLMAAFLAQRGGIELARQLLLLGSGYLEKSLGHSVSCTAFILLEMLERKDQDPWPALATLADYFCKGRFQPMPSMIRPGVSEKEIAHHLLRAASGRGIVNLHHTITLYAMERVRHLFSAEEHDQMIASWVAFMGDKRPEPVTLETRGMTPPADYERFYEIFSELDAGSVVASVAGMMGSEPGRRRLGRFLLKGLCDHYRGDYNPHFLTGLGSALWVMEHHGSRADIAVNALFQYVDFFLEGTRK